MSRRIEPAVSSSSGPSSGDHRVCIVFSCDVEYAGSSKRLYKFCVVDLSTCHDDGDRFTPISPTLVIDTGIYPSPVSHAFCVWGRTLYMFEGIDYSSNQKSVFTHDLSNNHINDADTIHLIKGGDGLTKFGDMLFPKKEPSAVLTPDGNKILLFSFSFHPCEFSYFGGYFELYDPKDGSSEALPLLGDTKHYKMHSVSSYGFISMFRFVVNILDLGTYVLDLEVDRHKRSWEELVEPVWQYIPKQEMGKSVPFVFLEDRFFFSPYFARDITNDGKRFQMPPYVTVGPSSFTDEYVFIGRDGTLLKHDKYKGESSYCALHFESKLSPSICNLHIDVCRAIYPKEEEGEEERLDGKEEAKFSITSSRALTLACKPEEGIYLSFPEFIFPI